MNEAEPVRDRGLVDGASGISAASGRRFLRLLLITAGVMVCAPQADAPVPADKTLAKLMDGNRRYARHKEQHPDESLARRKELQSDQHPFAVVLSCSDSRVPPELIFDQGLGDLFVIRVAGNIASDDELGSIEYSVEHLHTKLVMVLGHEKCGAITAAVEGSNEAGHLKSLVAAIQPSVEETRNLLATRFITVYWPTPAA
jgi:carbonic anhydrase